MRKYINTKLQGFQQLRSYNLLYNNITTISSQLSSGVGIEQGMGKGVKNGGYANTL